MDFAVKMRFPEARLLTAEQAPGIIGYLESIARKVGAKAPAVYLNPTHKINAAIFPATQSLVINQGAINATGSHVAGTPTPHLEAILAHEMGHGTNAWRHMAPIFTVLATAGLIGSASVYLYDQTRKHQKQAKEHGETLDLQSAFNRQVDNMAHKNFWTNFKEFYAFNQMPNFSLVGPAPTQPRNLVEYTNRQIVSTAAAALALPLILPAARPFALRNEFEADAFAAKMTGKPEVVIEMLDMLHTKINQAAVHTSERLGNKTAGTDVVKSARRWLGNLLNETIGAHPSWEARVGALKKLTPVVSHL